MSRRIAPAGGVLFGLHRDRTEDAMRILFVALMLVGCYKYPYDVVVHEREDVRTDAPTGVVERAAYESAANPDGTYPSGVGDQVLYQLGFRYHSTLYPQQDWPAWQVWTGPVDKFYTSDRYEALRIYNQLERINAKTPRKKNP
jgi:hypothetical protein